MKNFIFSIPLFAGLLLGFYFPFEALLMNRWSFLLLLVLMFLTTLSVGDIQWRSSMRSQSGLKVFLFSYLFLPSLEWMLCQWLGLDPALTFGFFMASICPFALVAPAFVPNTKSSKDQSFQMILLSMLFYPLIVVGLLHLFQLKSDLRIWPLFQDMILLTFAPVGLLAILQKLSPGFFLQAAKWSRHVARPLSLLLVGWISFIYLGSSLAKFEVSALDRHVAISLVAVAFFQDFGAYFLARLWQFDLSESVTISMKNVAVAGGVMIVFFPKALLSISALFLSHSFLFMLLPWITRETQKRFHTQAEAPVNGE